MDNEIITLELLIRSGNPIGVEKFANLNKFDDTKKNEKIAEAGIYSAIKVMWKEAEGGINSENVCRFLNQSRFTNYFLLTNNLTLLEELIDVLQAGTKAMMEAYAQITTIDILGIDSLALALRRNMDVPKIKEKLTNLVESGYSLVFCPHDIDADMIEHYFPIVDKWRDLINPLEVVTEAIENLSDVDDEYSCAALDKLILMTDRATVSELVFENFGDSEEYHKLLADGKIDPYRPQEETPDTKITRAVKRYENEPRYNIWDARDLAKEVGVDGKEYISQKMGDWFRAGKMRCLLEVIEYNNGTLYDHGLARKYISESIAEACKNEDLIKLGWVLKFPSYLIDETNSEIIGVITAYKISQETKEDQ